MVQMAHMVGVSVEGELGCLGSLETGEGEKEDGHGFEGKLDADMLVTDPDENQNVADFPKYQQQRKQLADKLAQQWPESSLATQPQNE